MLYQSLLNATILCQLIHSQECSTVRVSHCGVGHSPSLPIKKYSRPHLEVLITSYPQTPLPLRGKTVGWLLHDFLYVMTKQTWFQVSQSDRCFKHCHMTKRCNSTVTIYNVRMHGQLMVGIAKERLNYHQTSSWRVLSGDEINIDLLRVQISDYIIIAPF